MGFKTDREFLRNISVGAVGSRQVMRLLNAHGFSLIDIDRSALSCKIWETKVKRLRVPDLLCLKSGIRIESRAKGKLGIIMSHSPGNLERAWDNGLRDDDLIACIRCVLADTGGWQPGEHVALFRVGDMRQMFGFAKQSPMKSASEGNEVYVEWPSVVPASRGVVETVSAEKIVTRRDNGRRQSYMLTRKVGTGTVRLNPHVQAGDKFGEGDRIIASVLPALHPSKPPVDPSYNFLPDLESTERATVFCAVKALGFLQNLKAASVPRLIEITTNHGDPLVRLESAGALARLAAPEGWRFLTTAATEPGDEGYRMEAALLIGELGADGIAVLNGLANTPSNPTELRSAAVWGIGGTPTSVAVECLLKTVVDMDEDLALHALVALSHSISTTSIGSFLDRLGDDRRLSAGIVKAVHLSGTRPVEAIVTKLNGASGEQRSWLVYLLATLGRNACENLVRSRAPDLLPQLAFFWSYHGENWINRLDIADRLDFLLIQT